MCPSEAPRRVLAGGPWRASMEATREEAKRLADEGVIEIMQRGVAIDHTQPWRGPIRLRLKNRQAAALQASATVDCS